MKERRARSHAYVIGDPTGICPHPHGGPPLLALLPWRTWRRSGGFLTPSPHYAPWTPRSSPDRQTQGKLSSTAPRRPLCRPADLCWAPRWPPEVGCVESQWIPDFSDSRKPSSAGSPCGRRARAQLCLLWSYARRPSAVARSARGCVAILAYLNFLRSGGAGLENRGENCSLGVGRVSSGVLDTAVGRNGRV